ncbi:MAG: PAS domain S-box protein [Ardenticatenaceae bacterium]|nr:PAS domain S-box protein [Ardenticatenaceae bacterium]
MKDQAKSKRQLISELEQMRQRVAELEKNHLASLSGAPEDDARATAVRLFDSIFKNATFGLALLDRNGRVVAVNETQCAFLGYTERELLGMPFADFTHPDDLAAHLQLYSELLRGERESFSLDKRNVRGDGQVNWFRLGVSLVRDETGQPQFGMVVYADISDQKETEALLRQQNNLLQQAEKAQAHLLDQVQEEQKHLKAVLDAVPEGILLLDSDYHVLLANPIGLQYLSILAGALLDGRVTRLGDRILKELLTSPPVKGMWHEIVAGSRSFVAIVRPVRNGPEQERWVLVIHDATEEREMQQRAQQQDRLAVVGQLAAGIAHDFNNILSIITLDADLVLLGIQGQPENVTRLEAIISQVRQASDMIQQILDFGRRTMMERRPLPLVPFLNEQIKLLKRILPDNIRIRLAPADSSLVILADATRIQQIIMNLVVNARDAMPGGGQIRLKLEALEIITIEEAPVTGMLPGIWVRLQVSDTGSGIPAAIMPHIFDPFFTTKPLGKGSGLGLAQVQGLVQQHGGEIVVDSFPDAGTTFTLYFPAHTPLQMSPQIARLFCTRPGAGSDSGGGRQRRTARSRRRRAAKIFRLCRRQAGSGPALACRNNTPAKCR